LSRVPIAVQAATVNDQRFDAATGERQRFSSAILPPLARLPRPSS
jgi:putative transposase